MPAETAASMRRKLRPNKMRKRRAGGDGTEYPLRIAKVTRVDPKRMTVSIYCLTGDGDPHENVSLTFANAGARHFLGAIPDVNDLCVVGYSPSESGSSRQPYIVGWLVPGTGAGYDWLMTSATGSDEINMTPAMRQVLAGTFGRRRHKMRQMEAGNVVGSSSQGSDLHLNESVTLSNRRGNEIILRDQDQALVTRSLQRFHAGAGVRLYGGMVQRDSTLLPTQMFGDSVDWAANKQLDSEGNTLAPSSFPRSSDNGLLTPDPVFDAGLRMGSVSPQDVLARGLYVDDQGRMYDSQVRPDAVYGGKPMYRVSVDSAQNGKPLNGLLADDADVFTEWRIEVAHTSDGRLPVTEQTDGVDIDRLLPSPPSAGTDGTGDANPNNRSPNEAMVEFVLGTAIGNDPHNDRSSYGRPMVVSLFNKDGKFAPGVRAATPTSPVTDHAAFLVRVRNPTDPKAPAAFMAITKGGAFRSYFPGTGSKGHQEFFQTGKQVNLGQDRDGLSYLLEAEGTICIRGTGKGRQSDNVGLDFRSEGGAVTIFGGGGVSTGSGSPSTDPNLTPAATRNAVVVRSALSLLLESVGTTKIAGQNILVEDADTISITSNTALQLSSSDTLSVSAKSLSTTVTGKAEYTYAGPLDSKSSNGPSRTMVFNATAATGGDGGVVDDFEYTFGGRNVLFKVGRQDTVLNTGSFNVLSMRTAPFTVGQGSGIHLATGVQGSDNRLDLDTLSVELVANAGSVTVKATKGSATLKGSTTALVQATSQITLKAASVKINTPTPFQGAVITDGCINPITSRSHKNSGALGVSTFTVGS